MQGGWYCITRRGAPPMAGNEPTPDEELKEALTLCSTLFGWAADILSTSPRSSVPTNIEFLFRQALKIMNCSHEELVSLSLLTDSASEVLHRELNDNVFKGLDDILN